jgi:hypothetical protein
MLSLSRDPGSRVKKAPDPGSQIPDPDPQHECRRGLYLLQYADTKKTWRDSHGGGGGGLWEGAGGGQKKKKQKKVARLWVKFIYVFFF